MRKELLKLVSFGVILIVAIALSGCGSQQSGKEDNSGTSETKQPKQEEKTIELTLAHFFPATHLVETEIAQGYIKAIDEATGGRVKITSFPGGTLVPSQETYEGVVQGVADIGLSVYAFTRGRFPVIETFLMPGVAYNNSEAASWALMEGIEKLNPKEIQDTHHLFSFAAGPGDLMTTETPVRKLEDLKGLQIGATAGIRADAVEALGATPVVMPMNEWYEALSKSIMNGGVAPVESLQGFRLGEATGSYITLTPFLYNQLFFTVMNKGKWESLPPDIQQIMTDTTKKFYAEHLPTLFDRVDTAGLKWIKSQKEVEIITLPEEEQDRWLEKIKPLQDEYVTFLDEKGLPGDEILKSVKELADKYNKQYPVAAPYIK